MTQTKSPAKLGAAVRGGLLGLIFFIVLDVLLWLFPPGLGWGAWKWTPSGAIGIGDGVSIELQTRAAHPFLAEYGQRLRIYRGTSSKRFSSTVELPANTGGKTEVLVYSGRIREHEAVELVDRFGRTSIDLVTRAVAAPGDSLVGRAYVGVFSAKTWPLQFVPATTCAESLAVGALR